jgi:hypothetical protein
MPGWFPKIASHFLVFVLLVFVIQKMVRKSAAPSSDGYGKRLHYSRWFSGLGLVVFVMFVGMGIYSWRQPPPGWLPLTVTSGIFSLLGLFIFLYGLFTKVEVDDHKITSHVFWRSPVTLYWIEVQRVDFSGTKQFRIRALSGRKIHVDMLIGGLSTLLAGFSKNLSVDKYLEAMRAYWKTSKNYQQSFGSILAVPPSELAKVSAQAALKDLGALLPKLARHVEEGWDEKEVKGILAKVIKGRLNQGMDMELKVLFRGMPVRLYLFFFLLEDGKVELDFFAPLRLAELMKSELEKAGTEGVSLEIDEDEEEE